MKRLLALGVGCCWLARCALGQMSVEVDFEFEQYLAGEPLRAAVRLTNFSGRTLKLGETPDWLDVSVESDSGFVVGRTADPPVVESFELPSSSRATRWVDLVPYFNLGRPGRYRVTATVRIRELGLELTSKPSAVNISSGTKIWEQDFGLNTAAADAPPAIEVRRYALIQAMNEKKVTLFVRVSDVYEARVFRVSAIGPVLAFSHPEAQVDRSGQLHVLFQTSAKRFTYIITSVDGEIVGRQIHQYTNTRPKLRIREDGTVVVSGGWRLVTSSDIPKPEPVPEPVLDKTNVPPAAPSPDKAPGKEPPAEAPKR
jgi:hypothetical protein